MYEYVNDKSKIQDLRNACENIIKSVQIRLNEYFTFQFKLIGSGEKRLITQNSDGYFDLDYNLILQRDKKCLINHPEKIKDLFVQSFNEVNPKLGFSPAKNRKSVIKSNLILNQELYFSFDVAIMFEGNNGNLYKLIFDKSSQRYIWNEVRHSANFENKFATLKRGGFWNDIKTLYLKKKNQHLSNGDLVSSYSTLLEAVNEIWAKEM